jgi:hypothetical protein
MEERLKSVLKISQLRLILKSFIFAGFLFWVKMSGFGILPILLFLGLSIFLYFRTHQHNNSENISSFFILLAVSLAGISFLRHVQFLLIAIAFFSFLFYLILGIKDLLFSRRYEWNFIKNLLLIYSIFIVYFLTDKYNFFALKYSAIFIAIFLIIQEWFFWLEIKFPKRYRLSALVFSFLILQLLWAVSILPLGFINSATIMTIFVYLMFDFCVNHFKGSINKKLVVRNSIILILSLFIIFLSTNWKV